MPPAIPPDPLLSPEQTASLSGLLGAEPQVLAQVGSTNQELVTRAERAAAHGECLPDLSVLATEHQQSGRGRLDRDWITGPGEALTFSVLLHPRQGDGQALPTESFAWLTVLLAAAVAQTLRAEGLAASLKWPNDVLLTDAQGEQRKICGVLASLVAPPGQAPSVVIGAGINVEAPRESVPQSTGLPRTSLRESGSGMLRGELLVGVLERFVPLLRRFLDRTGALTDDDGALRAQILPLIGTLGAQVRAELPGDRPPLEGTAVGLDAQGRLLIDDGARVVAVSAGDVVHLRRAPQPPTARAGETTRTAQTADDDQEGRA